MLFEASNATPIYNERLAIVLGLITLLLAVTSFISCRTCVSWLKYLGLQNITTSRGYETFNRYHIYYWWAFGVFLTSHVLVAVAHTGWPQAADPDAGIHWSILGIGALSSLSSGIVFSSCRVLPRLAAMASSKSPISNPGYRFFFKYHTYYWGIFLSLAVVHFAISYSHAGIWPGG